MFTLFQRVPTIQIKPMQPVIEQMPPLCDELSESMMFSDLKCSEQLPTVPINEFPKKSALRNKKKKFSFKKVILMLVPKAFHPRKKCAERSSSITSLNTMANANQPLELCLKFNASSPRTSLDSGSGSERSCRSVKWSESIEVFHI